MLKRASIGKENATPQPPSVSNRRRTLRYDSARQETDISINSPVETVDVCAGTREGKNQSKYVYYI